MADEVMMKIGAVTLGIKGPAYDKLTRVVGKEWASQPRIGRRSAMQLTGTSDEVITLSGTIYGAFNGLGTGQVKKLEAAMEKETPLLVIDGSDRKYGYFVLTELSEDQSAFMGNGAPQRQEFTLTMKAYGEDQLSGDAVMDNDNAGLLDMRTGGNMA